MMPTVELSRYCGTKGQGMTINQVDLNEGSYAFVLADVAAERERQDAKWGGAAHDDEHSTAEFVQLIEDYAGWARTMAGMNSYEKAENRLTQVAALACAAVESSRRRRGAPNVL